MENGKAEFFAERRGKRGFTRAARADDKDALHGYYLSSSRSAMDRLLLRYRASFLPFFIIPGMQW